MEETSTLEDISAHSTLFLATLFLVATSMAYFFYTSLILINKIFLTLKPEYVVIGITAEDMLSAVMAGGFFSA